MTKIPQKTPYQSAKTIFKYSTIILLIINLFNLPDLIAVGFGIIGALTIAFIISTVAFIFINLAPKS